MPLTHETGNLIALATAGRFDVIGHGCNCMCSMGAGIAKSIRRQFPAAYEADLKTKRGDRAKLGTCTHVTLQLDQRSLVIVNAYTQFDWRGTGDRLDYDALRRAMTWMATTFTGKRFALPCIGTGLAGGEWSRIEAILSGAFADEDLTIVEYTP
ncbi:MAG TPA: macro domain-containing protein [Planctomycetota bacterium]|nr:macro domain-containing protein [Planctomycetota bacterium]